MADDHADHSDSSSAREHASPDDASSAPTLPPHQQETIIGQARLAADDQIGPYRIIEQLGEGGFAVVYLVEQSEPVRRKVALKVLKLGMDTEAVVARFRAEQQSLAIMDHPNVARVFDAGATPTGRPYFVMEYVRGQPITEYCDLHKLSNRERLTLFIDVCQAVQHAHHKGIIHRDLKPSNVLVSMVGDQAIVKVIDFGIARAMDPRAATYTMFTQHGQFIGTPEYMSPEQAGHGGQDVDARSDIYSLGVLLYELLTGTLPFDPRSLREAGIAEIERIIREQDPPRPSTRISTLGDQSELIATRRRTRVHDLRRELRGELDWIILRAMEKDRTRRYETANGVAREIERYLRDEPILAGPPGAHYRISKFIKRHRAGVTALSIATIGLVLGLAFALVGFAQARQQRDIARDAQLQAEASADEALSVNTFLISMLEQADPWKAGGEVSIIQALDASTRLVESNFADKPRVEAAARLAMAKAYRGIGLMDRAEEHVLRAIELRTAELGPDAYPTLEARRELGILRFEQDRLAEADEIFRDLLTLYSAQPQINLERVLGIHSMAGSIHYRRGELIEAETVLREITAQAHEALGADNKITHEAMNSLAWTLLRIGKLEEAEQLFQVNYDNIVAAHGEDDARLVPILSGWATVQFDRMDLENSEQNYQRALNIANDKLDKDNPATLVAANGLANVYRHTDRHAEALPLLERAVEVYREQVGPTHQHTLILVNNLAGTLSALRREDEAAALHEENLRRRIEALGEDHPDVAESYSALGAIANRRGDTEQAVELHVRAVETYQAAFGQDNIDVIIALANMSLPLLKLGRFDEVIDNMQRAVDFDRKELGPMHRYLAADVFTLAQGHFGAGNYATVVELVTESIAIWQHNESERGVARGMLLLGRAQVKLGDSNMAEPLLEQGIEILQRLGTQSAQTQELAAGMETLALIYEQTGRPELADEQRRALAALLAEDGELQSDQPADSTGNANDDPD